jgi:hypothetical protein
MRFSVYYHSPESGEYLRRVVYASGMGQLEQFHDLSDLASETGADVVLVEYQEDNPHLDRWIARTTSSLHSPEVFLFFKEASVQTIWKGLSLGARQCFAADIQPEDFQAAVYRAGTRNRIPRRKRAVCH